MGEGNKREGKGEHIRGTLLNQIIFNLTSN
jgi:hypothetical protein